MHDSDCRILTNRFENSAEYILSHNQIHALHEGLVATGHFQAYTASVEHDGIIILGDPSLYERPGKVTDILRATYPSDANAEEGDPYVLIINANERFSWKGKKRNVHMHEPNLNLQKGRVRLVSESLPDRLKRAKTCFSSATENLLELIVGERANIPRLNREIRKIKKTVRKIAFSVMDSVATIRSQCYGNGCQDLVQSVFDFAIQLGQRSVYYMEPSKRAETYLRLTKLAIDWISFACDDCIASDRKTFKFAIVALEEAMTRTSGTSIIQLDEEDFSRMRVKVARCMTLLISHFDILGARSALAAQTEMEKQDLIKLQSKRMPIDFDSSQDDEAKLQAVIDERMAQINVLETRRDQSLSMQHNYGRVLDESSVSSRSLMNLASSLSNMTLRWQQGRFLGGGTFGSVYAAINLDSGDFMAVKEIRLHDSSTSPSVIKAIKDEMTVLEMLDHPNIVSYYGIEVHRDKVFIFMEYCAGGSLANLLEHGRIEDEAVVQVYTLQLLEGLAYLHQRHIVHRDIKPESNSAK